MSRPFSRTSLTATTLLLLLLLLLNPNPALASSLNPCHARKNEQGKDVTCRSVTLPQGLCRACKIKPTNPDGTFTNCRAIYNVTAPNCLTKLQKYVAYNGHCDPVRKWSVANVNRYPNAVVNLDYFVYSVCEQCCDCIPEGAPKTPWGVFDLNRGNCPAHAYADVCKVLPQIGHMRVNGDPSPPPRQETVEPICPHLTTWRESPAGQNWEGRTVEISEKIKAFLGMMMKAGQCHRYATWTPCWELEDRQNRI